MTKVDIQKRNDRYLNDFLELLNNRKLNDNSRIVIFAGAAISTQYPSCLPLAKDILKATIEYLMNDLMTVISNPKVEEKINAFLSEYILPQKVAPEMIYDAIYEFAGEKIFRALDCCKSNKPNNNHITISWLLKNKLIDKVITTNFDGLIEEGLPKKFLSLFHSKQKNVWKIHGDINNPESLITTIHTIGRCTFNKSLLNKLSAELENSHVLFIGYGGMDVDLIPAFINAKMQSVYWLLKEPEEEEVNLGKNPWFSIEKKLQKKSSQIKWIVGDLYENFIHPLGEKLNLMPQKGGSKINGDKYKQDTPLEVSFENWKNDPDNALDLNEKACSILQIIYNIGLNSPSQIAIWNLLINIAESFVAGLHSLVSDLERFNREAHSFIAESYIMIGNLVEAKNHLKDLIPVRRNDATQAKIMLNTGSILINLSGIQNLQGAKHCFKEVIKIVSLSDIDNQQKLLLNARCYSNLSVLYFLENHFSQSKESFLCAEESFAKAGDIYGFIGLCINTSIIYIENGDLKKARGYAKKAREKLIYFPNKYLEKKLKDLLLN